MLQIDRLYGKARELGFEVGDVPTLEEVFALVRDMPYRRASTRAQDAIIDEWTGTCSGKHYLLKELFEELGHETKLMICTHRFTAVNSQHLAAELREDLEAHGAVPDVHNYLLVQVGDRWKVVDATWPTAAKAQGYVVNEQWNGERDMTVACEPLEVFEVPEEVDPQAFKEELIRRYCGEQLERRERFIAGLTAQLAAALS